MIRRTGASPISAPRFHVALNRLGRTVSMATLAMPPEWRGRYTVLTSNIRVHDGFYASNGIRVASVSYAELSFSTIYLPGTFRDNDGQEVRREFADVAEAKIALRRYERALKEFVFATARALRHEGRPWFKARVSYSHPGRSGRAAWERVAFRVGEER